MKLIPIFLGIAVILVILGIGAIIVPEIAIMIDEQINHPIDPVTEILNSLPNIMIIVGVWIFVIIAFYYLRCMSAT